jgi:hypothetical protein
VTIAAGGHGVNEPGATSGRNSGLIRHKLRWDSWILSIR